LDAATSAEIPGGSRREPPGFLGLDHDRETPVAFFIGALVTDAAAWLTGGPFRARASFWLHRRSGGRAG